MAIFDNQQVIKTSAFPPWSLLSSTVSLSLGAIENTIIRAYFDVCSLMVDINMYQQEQLLPPEKMFRLANLQLMKSRIVGYSCSNKYDSDFNSDTDDSSSEGDEEITGNDADNEDSFDDDDDLFDNLVNISASTFHGMRVFSSVNNSILANEGRSPSDQPILAPYFVPKWETCRLEKV